MAAAAADADVRGRTLTAMREPAEIGWAGALAGLVAGASMAVWSMSFTGVTGTGIASWLQAIAATFYGAEAMIRIDAVVVGGLIHFAISTLLGLWFAAMMPRAGVLLTMAAGLCYGLVLWALMTFGVMALVDPVMRTRVALQPGGWFVANVIFGAALTVLVPLRNSIRAAA